MISIATTNRHDAFMKTHITRVTFTATFAVLFTAGLAFPQEPVPPKAPQAPAPLAEPAPPAPPRPPLSVEPILENVRRQVDLARDQAEAAFGAAGDAFAWTGGPEGNFLRRAGARPVRSLVLPSAEMEPQSIATATEDLNIMARIFEKALPGRDSNKPERRAMGIAIFSGAGSGAIRNLYLEGYGALFFLEVRFPLLPPPNKQEQDKPKEPTSSAWEEARSELYNPRGPRGDGFAWKGLTRGDAEEYDADQVEQLKESLLEAFRHTTHIRAVKPDESISVVVSGGESGRIDVVRFGRGGDARELLAERANSDVRFNRRSSNPGESVLLIRARKADVDALAKGKIDLEQFKQKALIRIY